MEVGAEARRGHPPTGLPRGFLVGVVAGSGFVARAAEAGGADFVLALSAGRMRNMGTASVACMLPIADADALTGAFARTEVLAATDLPVLLGTSSFGEPPGAGALLAEGFAGAVNFPSTLHYGPEMRRVLEEAGLGFSAEVARLAAVEAAGGIAMLYCGTREQAVAGARAGIRHILYNYGWNAGGEPARGAGRAGAGHHARMSLHEAAQIAHEVAASVKRIAPHTRLLLEGGPIVDADDLGFVMRAAAIDGYIGGSTIERLPLERSVANRIAAYRMARHAPDRGDARRERLLRMGTRAGFVGGSDALLGFVETLHALAGGSDDLLLDLEPGVDPNPAIAVICDAMSVGRRTSRVVDVTPAMEAEALPLRARLLVAHDPHRMAPALLRALLARDERVVWVARAPEGSAPAPVPAPLSRLAAWRLAHPRLGERADDIEALWARACDRRFGPRRARPTLSPTALLALRGHDWPGGEAEFSRVVAALALPGRALVDGPDAEAALREDGATAPAPSAGEDMRAQILQALWRNGFRKGRTAAALGVSRKTLYNRMRRLGISG